jgi:hypothetical protein
MSHPATVFIPATTSSSAPATTSSFAPTVDITRADERLLFDNRPTNLPTSSTGMEHKYDHVGSVQVKQAVLTRRDTESELDLDDVAAATDATAHAAIDASNAAHAASNVMHADRNTRSPFRTPIRPTSGVPYTTPMPTRFGNARRDPIGLTMQNPISDITRSSVIIRQPERVYNWENLPSRTAYFSYDPNPEEQDGKKIFRISFGDGTLYIYRRAICFNLDDLKEIEAAESSGKSHQIVANAPLLSFLLENAISVHLEKWSIKDLQAFVHNFSSINAGKMAVIFGNITNPKFNPDEFATALAKMHGYWPVPIRHSFALFVLTVRQDGRYSAHIPRDFNVDIIAYMLNSDDPKKFDLCLDEHLFLIEDLIKRESRDSQYRIATSLKPIYQYYVANPVMEEKVQPYAVVTKTTPAPQAVVVRPVTTTDVVVREKDPSRRVETTSSPGMAASVMWTTPHGPLTATLAYATGVHVAQEFNPFSQQTPNTAAVYQAPQSSSERYGLPPPIPSTSLVSGNDTLGRLAELLRMYENIAARNASAATQSNSNIVRLPTELDSNLKQHFADLR